MCIILVFLLLIMNKQENNIESESLFERFIDKIFDIKYGIMGTIAFHMILAIILFSSELNSLYKEPSKEIIIDFDQEIVKKIDDLKKEIKKKEIIKNNSSEEAVNKLLKSIAVNENIKSTSPKDINTDVDKIIDNIQKDLDARNGNMYKKNDKDFKTDSIKYHKEEAQRKLDSIQTVYYSGPSSVSYNLKGRFKIYLPIPVFKCENSGLVKVAIIVNKYGRVTKATILENGSKTEDQCLWDTAIDAAKRSRFSENSKNSQEGTITYNFVKQ